MTDAAIVEITGLRKVFRSQVILADLSLRVAPGERIALVGPTGAGKSVLLETLVGLVHADAGIVRVLGTDPSGPGGSAVRRHVGYVPRNLFLRETLTVRETLAFFAALKDASDSDCRSVLERTRLTADLRRRVDGLSPAEHWRLTLAVALLGRPRLLLIDDPPPEEEAAWAVLAEALGERSAEGCAVIIASDRTDRLDTLVTRFILLEGGQIRADTSLAELQRRAGTPVRFRLRTPRGGAAALARRLDDIPRVSIADDATLDIVCGADEKMAMLRLIAGLGAEVRDVDLQQAPAGDLLAHLAASTIDGGAAGVDA